MQHDAPAWAWVLALEQSAAAQFARESVWLYPLANITHVLAIAALIGAILVFDLRVLGPLAAARADEAADLALPVARLGLALAVPSGLVMFATEASAYAANPVFLTKLGAIILALINLAVFHAGSFRRIAQWNGPPPASAKRAAAVSLAAWMTAAICGRFAAYL